MEKLILNRKIKILLENNAQMLFVFIGKKINSNHYLVLEIDDVNIDVAGENEKEIMEKLEALKEKTESKCYTSMPMDWLEEQWWVGDDEDLNLSIFNLIDYKLNPNLSEMIKNKENDKG